MLAEKAGTAEVATVETVEMVEIAVMAETVAIAVAVAIETVAIAVMGTGNKDSYKRILSLIVIDHSMLNVIDLTISVYHNKDSFLLLTTRTLIRTWTGIITIQIAKPRQTL